MLLSSSGAFALSPSSAVNQQNQVQLIAQSVPDVVVPTTQIPATTAPNTTTPIPTNNPVNTTSSDIRFTCDYVNGNYQVMYHPESQPGQEFPWARPTDMGDGWTPLRRCQAIAQRLEQYRPDGLEQMNTSVENGYNIVCVTTDKVPGCRIVFTVPPGQDPVSTRDRVFQSLTVADSGQTPDVVNTFTGSGNILNQLLGRSGSSQRVITSSPSHSRGPINLQQFLDPNDGGTGARLQGGGISQPAPSTSGHQLNIH
jgi:hypothetical protein